MAVTIYHNPRCSKSRAALQLIQDQGVEPTVFDYQKTPPDEATLRDLARKLGMPPSRWVRKDEAKELGIDTGDDEQLFKAMAEHPILIERPIVIKGDKAVLGRPPENVLDLF